MSRVAFKTMSFILIRVLLFILSGALQGLCVYLVYRTGTELTSFHPLLNTLIKPALIFIGLGIGSLGHTYLMRPVIHMFSLAHVVAATAVVLGLPVQGSLFKFAIEEIGKTFFQVTFSSLVSITAMKKLEVMKDAILNNDILSKFQPPKHWFFKGIINLCLFDIKGLLSMMDEILVSFTWFATYMFVKFDKSDKKGVRVVASNQAKFMLEGLVYLLRVFPHLLLANIGYGAMFLIVNLSIIVAVFATVWTIFGFTWWLIPLVFLTHNLLKDIIYSTLIYNFRLCFVIDTYYAQVDKIESVSQEDIITLITKIPCLKFLAKKTKLEEFKGLEESPDDASVSSMSGLVEMSAIDGTLRKTVNSVAKCFMINESDILKTSELSEPTEAPQDGGEEVPPSEDIPTEDKVEEVEEPAPALDLNLDAIPTTSSKIKPISDSDLVPDEEGAESPKYHNLFER